MNKTLPLLAATLLLVLGGCSTVNKWLGRDGDSDSKPADSSAATPDMNDPQQAADAFMQMIGRDFLPTCDPEVYFKYVAFPEGISAEKIAAGKKKLQESCLGLDNREERAQKTRAMSAHGMRDSETPGVIIVHYRGPDGEEQSYPFAKTANGWKYPFPFE